MSKIPPFDPTPKPKSKGKRPAPPKLEGAPDIEELDVFKALFHADAGSDPGQTLQRYLSRLSRSQLTRLERRVARIRRKVFKDKEERRQHDEACDQMAAAIAERTERARKEEAALRVRIQEKLEELPLVGIHRTETGSLTALRIDGHWLAVRTFIKRYLSDEYKTVARLLEEGNLIPLHGRYGPIALIKRIINDYV